MTFNTRLMLKMGPAWIRLLTHHTIPTPSFSPTYFHCLTQRKIYIHYFALSLIWMNNLLFCKSHNFFLWCTFFHWFPKWYCSMLFQVKWDYHLSLISGTIFLPLTCLGICPFLLQTLHSCIQTSSCLCGVVLPLPPRRHTVMTVYQETCRKANWLQYNFSLYIVFFSSTNVLRSVRPPQRHHLGCIHQLLRSPLSQWDSSVYSSYSLH